MKRLKERVAALEKQYPRYWPPASSYKDWWNQFCRGYFEISTPPNVFEFFVRPKVEEGRGYLMFVTQTVMYYRRRNFPGLWSFEVGNALNQAAMLIATPPEVQVDPLRTMAPFVNPNAPWRSGTDKERYEWFEANILQVLLGDSTGQLMRLRYAEFEESPAKAGQSRPLVPPGPALFANFLESANSAEAVYFLRELHTDWIRQLHTPLAHKDRERLFNQLLLQEERLT